MSSLLEDRLLANLAPHLDAPAWRVGYSGGLDSSVLLHALSRLGTRHRLPPLLALHVHHGLSPQADGWARHCESLCAAAGIPLVVEQVVVDDEPSLEQAARRARYAAFRKHLQAGECLITAQHRDDLSETLLFRLLRGAGVRGLTGMPATRELGEGTLVRPLMEVDREELLAYAQEQGLHWIEDPSNADTRLSRNYLRHQVMPVLRQRWPQASQSMARTARHMADAEEMLGELAAQDLAVTHQPGPVAWLPLPNIELAPLLGLSPARQRNAIRYWLAPLTLMPDAEHWASWDTLRDAAEEADARWVLDGGELRRGHNRIWWLSGVWLETPAGEIPWDDPRQPLQLPGNGSVRIEGPVGRRPLSIRYRQGGEVALVPGRGHRDLKRLFNERRVPVFLRGRLPLLFCGEELLAVANLSGLSSGAEGLWRLHWEPPTNGGSLR